MMTQTTQTPPPSAGFWKIRHLVIGGGAIVLIVMLMLRACGSDDADQEAAQDEKNLPRQAVVVQIPASQWPPQQAPVQVQPQVLQPQVPQQPGYGYIPQPLQPPPVNEGSNPWAVQRPQSYDYGQSGAAQWGQAQRQRAPQPQQYAPTPAAGGRYRPLDEGTAQRAVPQPQPQPQVQGYRPLAPYDRPAGSSFGAAPQAYPYAGGYPGYYGGAYGVPVNPYTPGYPGVVPGAGWPGVW